MEKILRLTADRMYLQHYVNSPSQLEYNKKIDIVDFESIITKEKDKMNEANKKPYDYSFQNIQISELSKDEIDDFIKREEKEVETIEMHLEFGKRTIESTIQKNKEREREITQKQILIQSLNNLKTK